MPCSLKTMEKARCAAKLLFRLRTELVYASWRKDARELWETMRRRHPVALIYNSSAKRIYQCILCGAELEKHNDSSLRHDPQVLNFQNHHNYLKCCQ